MKIILQALILIKTKISRIYYDRKHSEILEEIYIYCTGKWIRFFKNIKARIEAVYTKYSTHMI